MTFIPTTWPVLTHPDGTTSGGTAPTQAQLDGITKARLHHNLANVAGTQHADDEAYAAFVCEAAGLSALPEAAADSYASQYASDVIVDLETQLAVALADAAADPAPIPPAPPPSPTGDPLLDARLAKRSAINRVRDALASGGCDTPKGRVDTSLPSIVKINGAVTLVGVLAQQGQPFSIEWTMADNTNVHHDGAAMIAMGIAVAQHEAALHAHAVALKAQVEAAADIDAVNAIDEFAGWP